MKDFGMWFFISVLTCTAIVCDTMLELNGCENYRERILNQDNQSQGQQQMKDLQTEM